MPEARKTISIDGVEYAIVPETFVEGAIRRQAEFAYLGEQDLKSRPDTREFLHNSWIGGSQWEKPVYSASNLNTYFEAGDVSLTDRAGAVQQSAELTPLDGNLNTPSAPLIGWSSTEADGAVTLAHTGGNVWQWYDWDSVTDAFVARTSRTTTLTAGSGAIMAGSGGSDGRIYALFKDGNVLWYDPAANTNGSFDTGRTCRNGAAIWADRDYVWVWNASTLYNYDINATDVAEVQTVTTDGTGGTFTLSWDGNVSGNIAYNATTGAMETAIEGITGITAVTVTGSAGAWVIQFDDGNGDEPLLVADDTNLTGQTDGTVVVETTHGSKQYEESAAAIADDDWGTDAWSAARLAFPASNPVIPEYSCTRAISTSEGIFYVKNVFEGGAPAAKVYRVDRDASGTYILTPVGTLPKGQVAINIAHHLGSILISTVPNFRKLTENQEDQKVTIYHVTGRSIGAIGSPLGGTNIDESPVWFLGSYNEMLFIGGRKRIWLYDGRVGAFHPVHVESDAKYLDYGGGFHQMTTVETTKGSGPMFAHANDIGTSVTPYFEAMTDDSLITTANDTAFVTSNWFDFDLPMEQKTIHEVFYDSEYIRTDSTVQIQVSADGGAFSTVATITGGTSADTARSAVTTPITGYKFQYKLVFSTDTITSSAEPGRIYSVGFGAYAGEMVDIIQFTIDGMESINLENEVQQPEDVYDNMAALRANRDEVIVIHTYRQLEGDTDVTNTYRVMSVTGRKARPRDGMYEVQLIEVP